MDRGADGVSHPLVRQPPVAMSPESGDGATYVFVIRGELDRRYGHVFEGMEMERTGGTTVVMGRLRDPADFYGLVDRIEDLGLELISAQKTATGPAGSDRERDEA